MTIVRRAMHCTMRLTVIKAGSPGNPGGGKSSKQQTDDDLNMKSPLLLTQCCIAFILWFYPGADKLRQ